MLAGQTLKEVRDGLQNRRDQGEWPVMKRKCEEADVASVFPVYRLVSKDGTESRYILECEQSEYWAEVYWAGTDSESCFEYDD
jgi:hypothetical protein